MYDCGGMSVSPFLAEGVRVGRLGATHLAVDLELLDARHVGRGRSRFHVTKEGKPVDAVLSVHKAPSAVGSVDGRARSMAGEGRATVELGRRNAKLSYGVSSCLARPWVLETSVVLWVCAFRGGGRGWDTRSRQGRRWRRTAERENCEWRRGGWERGGGLGGLAREV